MDKYIFDESNGLWNERHGDYFIPCLTLPEEDQPIGLCGQRHLRYRNCSGFSLENKVLFITFLEKASKNENHTFA